MRAGLTFEVWYKFVAVRFRRALKGVGIEAFFAQCSGVGGEEVVHLGGDEVGVPVGGTEDDGLLAHAQRRAVGGAVNHIGEHLLEEVAAHGLDSVGEDDLLLEVVGVVAVGDLLRSERLSGVGVSGVLLDDFSKREAACVEVHEGEFDVHRREIAVLHRLTDFVLVDWRAEPRVVVGGDGGVGLGFGGVFGGSKLARRGSEADLHRVGIHRQHLGPLAPRRTVALVDDDVGEVVGWIVFREERFVAVVGVYAEGLVGGDVNGGVAGMVLAVGVALYLPSGVAKVVGEFTQGLPAEFVTVA